MPADPKGPFRPWLGQVKGRITARMAALTALLPPCYPGVDLPLQIDVHLGGRGIALVPSVFVGTVPQLHQHPIDPTAPPWLVVPPAEGRLAQASLWAGRRPRGAALAALVGRNRAAVLRAIAGGCTTTEPAGRVGISLASASQHASVLRDAGLITTHRQGSGPARADPARHRAAAGRVSGPDNQSASGGGLAIVGRTMTSSDHRLVVSTFRITLRAGA